MYVLTHLVAMETQDAILAHFFIEWLRFNAVMDDIAHSRYGIPKLVESITIQEYDHEVEIVESNCLPNSSERCRPILSLQ